MATVSELSKKYSSQLSQLQAIFPEWEEGDLVFALQDSKGNVEETVLAISEGRASQFTQATKKKAPKTTSTKAHGGRNDAGWDNVDNFSGGRGGRSGGRGGRGGAVAGRGGQAIRGARVGRVGARGGRGGYGNVNGGGSTKVPAEGSGPEWPTTTATSADGWSSQVEQAEAASAHEDDDGGWGEPAKPEAPSKPTWADLAKGEDKSKVAGGAWGSKPKKAAPAPSEKPAAPAPAPPAAPVAAPVEKPAEPVAPAAPAAPPAPAKKTWAQIAKPVEKPKPVPPPAPKAPEPQPEPEVAEEEVAEPEPEAAAAVEEESAPVEEAEPESEAVVEEEAVEEEVVVAEPEVAAPAEPEPAAAEEWVDPAIASATATAPVPAAAPEPVTTYTGPPGFNTAAAKAVPQQSNSRTNSRAAQRYKNADGQAVVLPASAGSWGAAGVEMQFGSLSFGGRDGDGVEAPVPAEPVAAPEAAPAASPVRTTQQAIPAAAVAQPPAPAQAAAPSSYYGQQQAPQQPAGFPPSQTLQQQYQAYQSYGQQQQQPAQAQAAQEHAPQQHQQQQQSQYGAYRQQDYYGSQQQQQQPQQTESQAPQQQQQQQPQQPQQPQQHSYDSAPFGGFGGQGQLFGQPAAQHNEYGQNRNFDSYSSGYPRPPAEEPKQAAPAPSHTPSAPAQPQQNLPHQQHQQYYSTLGNMGYYQSGPYNPYYQYGQAPNPGFQQYYPMASRNLYGQPAPQVPPAPIPASKPTPPAHHSPYGAPPSSYPSSGFDDQSFGLGGRYGDANKAGTPQSGAAQGQQNPQPIGGSIPQSYPSQQQGIHSFLGGNSTPSSSLGSGQPARQAGTPDDNFKAQPGAAASGATAGAGRTQPQQPQAAQQGFNSYPYGGYQNHDWSPYGQQQQHYSGSRNGGYTGWQQ